MNLKIPKLIKNREDLFEVIKLIHTECNKLCKLVLGKYLPAAGNIGVFCHDDAEYRNLVKIRKEITKASDNIDQKYFTLNIPITFEKENGIPKTSYTHLYIRKSDKAPYGKYLGDVDFVLKKIDYHRLKSLVGMGKIKGAKIYDRPGWDTIEITDLNINAVSYVSTQEFAEKVRIRFD